MQSPLLSAQSRVSAQAVKAAICPSTSFFARTRLRPPSLPHSRTRNKYRSRQVTNTYSPTKPPERQVPKRKARRKRRTRIQLPAPARFQQTVRRSFTLGGLGYHTGEYAHIRVRPAHAGEGRYFVKVPLGTNSHLFQVEEDSSSDEEYDQENTGLSPEDERSHVEMYYMYLAEKADGYAGTYQDFQKVAFDVPYQAASLEYSLNLTGDEEVVTRSKTDNVIPATLDAAIEWNRDPDDYIEEMRAKYTTAIGNGTDRVQGAEHLLGALEGMGVDNARIEIEGGYEVPIVDGSAMGWCKEIIHAQLRPATPRNNPGRTNHRMLVVKKIPAPKREISIREGESFMMFYPLNKRKMTYGIDHSEEAPIIGKQWHSWAPSEDRHFRYEIAPARTFNTSALNMMTIRGGYELLKGGTENCAINALGTRWTNVHLVRFHNDEPVRHKLLDLMGDLSLLARPGHSGVPLGHLISYQADHTMHIEFLKALKGCIGPDDWVLADQDNYKKPEVEFVGTPGPLTLEDYMNMDDDETDLEDDTDDEESRGDDRKGKGKGGDGDKDGDDDDDDNDDKDNEDDEDELEEEEVGGGAKGGTGNGGRRNSSTETDF